MEKILQGSGLKVGTLFANLDTNFISLCNFILKIAEPDYNLLGYAESDNEPSSPSENDCYLVIEAGTIWELTAGQYDIIIYNGSAWELLPYKITQINAALQAFYFDAENIALDTPHGMSATNLQAAIEELAALHYGSAPGSGSGSCSGSV